MRARLAMLAALCTMLGCAVDYPEGRIVCSASSDCPATWSCIAMRCYSSADASTDAQVVADAGVDALDIDATPALDAGDVGTGDVGTDSAPSVDAFLVPDAGRPLTPTEEGLSFADGAAMDHFGIAVALAGDGSRAIVGASDDGTSAGTDTGSARVYLRTGTTWTSEATLIASGETAGDLAGWAVAMSSDGVRAVVTVPRDDAGSGGTDSGSARVFLRTGTTWTEEATLRPADASPMDNFGWSAAIDATGTRVVVGAIDDDLLTGTDVGSATVFVRTGTTWTPEMQLTPSAGPSSQFGAAVAITADGDRIIVGAIGEVRGGAASGTAHIFLRSASTWSEEAVLVAMGAAGGDEFGSSVDITADGTRAVVGAHHDDVGAAVVTDAGSAKVFARTGTSWAQEASLIATSLVASAELGASVAFSGDGHTIIVGAPGDTTTVGSARGAAQIFTSSGAVWTPVSTLTRPTSSSGDGFGISVAVTDDGSRALVGAWRDDAVATDAGGAWAYLLPIW